MEEDAQSTADRSGQIGRKLRDVAGILPLLGIVLFASPLIYAITGGEEGELPSAAFYVFAIWGALIVLAFVLSRFLRDEAGPE